MEKKIIGIICSDTQYVQIENSLQFPNVISKRIGNIKKNKLIRFFSLIKELKFIDILYIGHGTGSFPYAAVLAKLFRKKVVIHWIGTDVLDFKKSKFKKLIKKKADMHLACSKLISEELMDYKINAKIIPIIPLEFDFEIAKMPEKHAVLFYLPTGREEFYGSKYLEYLSKKYKDLNFYVVGNETNKFSQSNVHNLGKINLEAMDKLYNNISILVRVPKHDGLSIMLLEALLRGKQVLYCYDFPFTYWIKSLEDADKFIEKILSSKPKVNIDGREYVLKHYNLNEIKRDLYKLLNEKKIV